jgi:hypothetical protein
MIGSIVGGGLSAIGSIAGGLMAGNAEKRAMNYQKGMSEKSILGQLYAQNMNDSLMSPGYGAYRAATPLLTYMLTGVNTNGDFTDADIQELNALRDQKQELLRQQSLHMGSATGSRSNQRKARSLLADIDAKLARLSDLENRYAADQAIQQVGSEGFIRDPGYQWQQQQGEKAVNRALAARGMYNSRAGVNALSDFNQNLNADTYQRQVNNLYNLSNLGRGASATGASLNQNSAINTGNTLMQTGQLVGQGMTNYGQTMGGTVANALGALGTGISNYSYMNALGDIVGKISNMNSSYNPIGGAFDASKYSVMGW